MSRVYHSRLVYDIRRWINVTQKNLLDAHLFLIGDIEESKGQMCLHSSAKEET